MTKKGRIGKGETIPNWGDEDPQIGKRYSFKTPVKAVSIPVEERSKRDANKAKTEREFNSGKFLGTEGDSLKFRGHKVKPVLVEGEEKKKKGNQSYLFFIPVSSQQTQSPQNPV